MLTRYFVALCILLAFSLAYAEGSYIKADQSSMEPSKDSIRELEKRLAISNMISHDLTREKMLALAKTKQAWRVDIKKNGKIHTVDRAYGNPRLGQYASVSIGESTTANDNGRLLGINILVPFGVDKDKGMFVSFCKLEDTSDGLRSSCDTKNSFVASYYRCNQEDNICLVSIPKMTIATLDNARVVNVLSGIDDNDDMAIAFSDAGTNYSFLVSLQGFKSRYNKKIGSGFMEGNE